MEFGSLTEETEMKRFRGATAKLFSSRRAGELRSLYTWQVSILTGSQHSSSSESRSLSEFYVKKKEKCVYFWFLSLEFSIDLTLFPPDYASLCLLHHVLANTFCGLFVLFVLFKSTTTSDCLNSLINLSL